MLANMAKVRSLFGSIPESQVRLSVPLASLGRWKIGGEAAVVVAPGSEAGLAAALRAVQELDLPCIVIGDGSNLLFDDRGFAGVVIQIGRSMSAVSVSGSTVTAQAGRWVPSFAHQLACAGLSGAEHIVGIPGTIGGLAVMNGGSQRKGIGSSITRVRCLDKNGEVREFTRQDCDFSYRKSVLQRNGTIVTSIDFEFTPADPATIRSAMLAILQERRRKFPLKLPNCGSVFVSDPAMYAKVGPPGMAIENVGLRGTQVGGARIADLHCNFIVNCGGASSSDVLSLIKLARSKVHDATGYLMDCEVQHVSPSGTVMPAHFVAELV